MSKAIDMTGWDMSEKIEGSQLLVLEQTERPQSYQGKHLFWKCKCKACGNIFIADGTKIRNGHTKSDGCWQAKNTINIGDRFGKLTIIAILGPLQNKSTQSIWYKCQCDCGKIIQACAKDLHYGSPRSCGCLIADNHNKKMIEENTNITYNYLTALYPTNERISNGSVVWAFRCQCGKICKYPLTAVKRNIYVSCGCQADISIGEAKIKQILDINNISYIYNKQFFKDLIFDNGILRYDFIILNTTNEPVRIIEYDGIQHFKSVDYFGGENAFKRQQERDTYKNLYALSHNIPLVRIPYTELNNISYELLFSDKYLITGGNIL